MFKQNSRFWLQNKWQAMSSQGAGGRNRDTRSAVCSLYGYLYPCQHKDSDTTLTIGWSEHRWGCPRAVLRPDLLLPPQSLVDMAPKYILEQFLQQELLINITEHEVSGAGEWNTTGMVGLMLS